MSELLALAAELVDIPSVSRHEAALADRVEADARAHAHLQVERVGDSVVARTMAGRPARLLLAGHLDTVPPFSRSGAHLDGDTLSGLGAVDMKGGLAVLLSLLGPAAGAALDVTFVFYACEEIERDADALASLARTRPELLAADAAVLAEPTGGVVEAGCQGTLRAVLHLAGRRAHTARPWQGVNAVHRLHGALAVLLAYHSREVVLDGCTYAEQLQAVRVEGGVAGNVVPDQATLTVNYRFAPDREVADAEAELRRLFGAALDCEAGDRLEVVDRAAGARPGLGHPLLTRLVEGSGAPPRAKLGWTDVATLAEAGVAAANFGPGDPLLAHTPDEQVTAGELDHVRSVLAVVLGVRGEN
ncbi:MAG TPA: succinyl-diaminopimelate desuccinylase [Acidimicrobiales bacterium]|nr:succinyl-diaminopimelate desuccinylase [Acidimicrobiales bacterium]